MDVRLEVLLLIVGCGLITFVQRVLPITVLKGWRPPKWFIDWLEFLPTAVMSALVGIAVFFPESDHLVWEEIRPFLYTSIPTAIVAFTTRSLGATVLVGVGVMYVVLQLA